MIVCAHGDVDSFCRERHMIPVCKYEGDIENYSGSIRVLVTDTDFEEGEYYIVKSYLLAKGIELVSTRHEDSEFISKFIFESLEAKCSKRHGGRSKFGFRKVDGKDVLTDDGRAVVKRILEMRDNGCTYQKIRDDEGVHHPDGRSLNISTIQIIIQNRKFYEKEGL